MEYVLKEYTKTNNTTSWISIIKQRTKSRLVRNFKTFFIYYVPHQLILKKYTYINLTIQLVDLQ